LPARALLILCSSLRKSSSARKKAVERARVIAKSSPEAPNQITRAASMPQKTAARHPDAHPIHKISRESVFITYSTDTIVLAPAAIRKLNFGDAWDNPKAVAQVKLFSINKFQKKIELKIKILFLKHLKGYTDVEITN
jgi:hypothetical protein